MQRALPSSAIPDQAGSDHIRRIRNDSFSGSEGSSGYSPYSAPKHELEVTEEDMHAALTSQSLNADGTPKRPMNAFMIFARKRRPEVSAANQTMRTGDISKILSREWNAMELSDKQFYLDQAKKLKDNFNAKYPDYVYRRRPNNSRKKRRTDAGGNRLPDTASLDGGDEYSGATDWEDHSPVDGDDTIGYTPELQYSRGHLGGYGHPKDDNPDFLPRPGGYASFDNPQGHFSSSHYSTGGVPNPHSYPSQLHIAGHSQSPPLYTDHGVAHGWQSTSSRVEGRSSGWQGPLGTQHEQCLSPLSSTKDVYSPRSWSSSISSDSSSASSSALPVHGQNGAFPTLNSPFYPHAPGAIDEGGAPHAGASHYFPSSAEESLLGRTGVPYDNPSYARSSNATSGSFLPGTDTFGRSTLTRTLPSIHSMPAYGLQNLPSMTSPASTSVNTSSHIAYWDRDRVGGS